MKTKISFALVSVLFMISGGLVSGIFSPAAAHSSRDVRVMGLTSDQRLVRFTASRSGPGKAKTIGTISGLTGDAMLIGIDYRVQDGLLYGVGNLGGLYTLDTSTAGATKVDVLDVAPDPQATGFGVDFNPAANALRVVSSTGQNLRHSFVTNTTTPDSTLTPPDEVVGAAYTNNDLGAATATTLFDISSSTDRVLIQAPPNNGNLNPVGNLGVDTTSAVGFDIRSKVRDGVTVSNTGYASLTGPQPAFYSVDLLTGKAKQIDSFRASDQVVDIAVALSN